jgi:NAD(P)-dependent dehydrogenase (short-subunit alcohol dehydrogenase family)
MTRTLEGKVAIVYGGSGSIGGAVACCFAREGAHLFLAGRSRSRLEAAAANTALAGGVAEVAELDVLDADAVEAHAKAIAKLAGGIDVVLNAVSIQHDQGTTLDDLSPEEFLRPVTGSLLAQFLTTKAVVPHMGRVRPGVILSLSEPGARLAMPGILGHASAAAAKEAMVRVLAAELAPKLIRVIGIRPHAIADAPAAGSFTAEVFAPLAARAGQDISAFLSRGPRQSTLLKRLPLLAEVAETVTFLASDRSGIMTGTTVNISGGALVD